jgi:hypothetical protein
MEVFIRMQTRRKLDTMVVLVENVSEKAKGFGGGRKVY